MHGDTIRPELKLSGGCQEEIDLTVLRNVFKKYGLDPYHCNLYTEFVEFYGWRRRKSIGFVKLADYDCLALEVPKNDPNDYKD